MYIKSLSISPMISPITCRSGTTEPTPKAKAKAKNKAKAKAKSMPGAAVVEEGAKTLDQLKAEVCNLFANLGVNGDGPVLCAVSQTYQNAMYLPNPDEETQPN